MEPTPQSRVAFLVLVFALLLFTSAAFGAAGGRFQKADGDTADPTCVEPTEEPAVDEGEETEPVEGEETEPVEGEETEPVEGEETEPVEGEETEPVEGEEICAEDEGEDESEPADAGEDETLPADEERALACMEAAGVEPVAEGDDAELADEEKLTGLDNAVDRVLANCLKNPGAPGLVNALEHLAANRERHDAHDAWKAERAAEREAAKAERAVAHDQAKAARDEAKAAAGHGNPHAA